MTTRIEELKRKYGSHAIALLVARLVEDMEAGRPYGALKEEVEKAMLDLTQALEEEDRT